MEKKFLWEGVNLNTSDTSELLRVLTKDNISFTDFLAMLRKDNSIY